MRKKLLLIVLSALVAGMTSSCSHYESCPGDPMHTQICTLDNGLKIYMTVNKTEPRLQTMIAVKVGGKNDPSDNTGLAHYFEHIMFKGTEKLGTSDFASEKVLLDEIERLFEIYKLTTDEAERASIYHKIDSLSYAASLISIPNEYDKAMAVIGAKGTNAFTSNDVTCYVEDIPSNRIDDWARIQADRFRNVVIRGFHTELETIYEEYNMYLNDDNGNAMAAADSVLFPHHPYGLQAVIGTSEHLKNPSISAIKRQKATYYVPNNIAICVSGDFEPKELVASVKKYFGDWEPNKNLPKMEIQPEEPITTPVEKTVYGTEAEFVTVSWRTPGACDIESNMVAEVASSILYNGMAGLMDIGINQQQKTLSSGAFYYGRTDWGEIICMGYPKQGQSLEEVRDLLLGSVRDLREGNFDESLVAATVANAKLSRMKALENNRARAMMYVDSFIAGHDWADDVKSFARLEKITKQDIVDWARENLGENSYVTVFKKLGQNPKNDKVSAPKITPIATNRDARSEFLAELQENQVKPIEPVFYNYKRDLGNFDAKSGVEVIYRKNEVNDIATMAFRFDTGKLNDPALGLAFDYISYLGTPSRAAAQIASEMYALACEYSLRAMDSNCTYSVSGLSENVGKALEIVEDLIANAIPDENVLNLLKANELKGRADSKFNQRAAGSALRNYQMYGPEYVKASTLTNDQVLALTSEELLGKIRSLLGKEHTVLYYGPASEKELSSLVCSSHKCAETLEPVTKAHPQPLRTDSPSVVIAPYDSRQFNYTQFSNRGETYSPADEAALTLFNEYFGGGMNSVVFQEMREARALAYSAYARLSRPSYSDSYYTFYAVIGSQNDKLRQAVEAFDDIIENIPRSEKAFEIAKTALDAQLRTKRYNGATLINKYIADREFGLTEPSDKAVFEAVSKMTLDDLVQFQQKWIKGRNYSYSILGDPKGLDQKYLGTLGPVKVVSLDEVFGY